MADNFYVTVHSDNDYGYIEYNPATKMIKVELKEENRKKVLDYLSTTQTIHVPQDTLRDFHDIVINPQESVDNLKLALTRMWGKTGVLVDWSYPHIYTQSL